MCTNRLSPLIIQHRSHLTNFNYSVFWTTAIVRGVFWLSQMRVSIQGLFSSVAQLCPTLCNPIDWSSPGFAVHHQLPEPTQTHVHRISDAIQPSHPLLPPSPLAFPASGSFPVSWFFASGGQSIGASALASGLPVNIQDWFSLGFTGWISLQSKQLSAVSSNTTVQKHQFWELSFLYSPTLTFIYDYWKNHSFD